MNHPLIAVTLLASTLLTVTLATAQSVTLRGEVTDGSAAGCYYCPGYQHVIKFSGTRLHSTAVNLNAFMDQQVEIHGVWDGTVVEVTSAQVVPESFSISGNASIGRTVVFRAHGQPRELAFNVASLGTGMLIPIGDLGVLVDPGSALVLGFGVLDGGGQFASNLDIPNNPALSGARMFGQSLILDSAPAFYSTNLDAKDIR